MCIHMCNGEAPMLPRRPIVDTAHKLKNVLSSIVDWSYLFALPSKHPSAGSKKKKEEKRQKKPRQFHRPQQSPAGVPFRKEEMQTTGCRPITEK